MKNLLTFSSLIIILLFSACEKEKLTANGHVISETRSLEPFTGVHTSGASAVHIIYGNEYKVELKGSSNLVPYFDAKITNNKLYLGYQHVNVKRDDIEIFVTMPSVRYISLSGSVNISVAGNFPPLNFLNLELSGSGEMTAESLMIADEVNIDISGSGNVAFGKLTSKIAQVNISGSGAAAIAVLNRLKATISGSGKVHYTGNAVVETHISGSGRLIKY
jgi:hypothetical protein